MLRFQKVENVFRYAPIFKILYDESLFDSAWNALSSGHFTIELNSMLDYPKEIAFDWETDIGFNPFADFDNVDLKECFELKIWSSLNRQVQKISKPHINGIEYPHGSVLDFNLVPIRMQYANSLINWLAFRNICISSQLSHDRDLIIRKVQRAEELRTPIVSSADGPLGIGTHYISWDKLFTAAPVQWIFFENGDDGGDIMATIREKVIQITASYIDQIFGECRNGLRIRAVRAVKSGQYIIKTLKMAKKYIAITNTCI